MKRKRLLKPGEVDLILRYPRGRSARLARAGRCGQGSPVPRAEVGGPSRHLRDATWVVCTSCGGLTVLKNAEIDAGETECLGCRRAATGTPASWRHVNQAETPSRREIRCAGCGRTFLAGRNVPAEVRACPDCLGISKRLPDPPTVGEVKVPRHAASLRAFVEKHCCNHQRGGCLMRGSGECVVVGGRRCGWFEEVFRPGVTPMPEKVREGYAPVRTVAMFHTGRRCPECGDPLRPRHRYCDLCAERRHRESKRECARKRRKHNGPPDGQEA